MKRFFLFLTIVLIISCNNNSENEEESTEQGPLHLPVNFDSTYHLCLGRDTLAVKLVDTSGGQVLYLNLADSIVSSKTHAEFIQAVENCFE
jgi:hypothetical protein